MRRGQEASDAVPPEGPCWSKLELMTAGDLSPKGFDTIRKAARVPGPTHGGLKHAYSAQDLFALIHKAESGKFTVLGPGAAAAWRALLAEAGIAVPETVSRSRRR